MDDYLLTLKNETKFLENWLNNLDSIISELKFSEDDIRRNYFQMIYNNVKEYKVSYTSFIISYLINTETFKVPDLINRRFGYDLMSVKALSKSEKDMKSYFYSMNHRVFIMSWSVFELAISTLFNIICPEESKIKYCNKKFNELKSKIPEESWEFVKNKLKTPHPQFLPITIKYGYLMKISKGYPGIKEKDISFLEFFGKFRNTVHSNFIYYGKDYCYNFGQAHFKFENEKIVEWTNPFEKSPYFLSVELYIHLIGRLNEIALNIFKSIDYDQIIYYPDLKQI